MNYNFGSTAGNLPSSRYVLPQFEERTPYGFKRQDPYTKLFEAMTSSSSGERAYVPIPVADELKAALTQHHGKARPCSRVARASRGAKADFKARGVRLRCVRNSRIDVSRSARHCRCDVGACRMQRS